VNLLGELAEGFLSLRNYELVWIIGGDSTDDEAVSSVSAMSDLVEQGGGQVVHTESWGHRSLAYKIKQNVEGVYSVARFTMEPSSVVEMERAVQTDQKIIRHLLTGVEANVTHTVPKDIDAAPADHGRQRSGPRR